MKRCPKCDFIYEDDQSLCDMDGVLLVLDSRNLPNLHALTKVPSKAPTKRNRAVPAFATVILALVLGMVYYVSIHRRAALSTDIPPAAVSAIEPVPVVNPTPEPQPSEEAQAPAREEPKRQPPAKKQLAKASVTTNKTESEPKKDESKFGSILKKTGRILKKPFKF